MYVVVLWRRRQTPAWYRLSSQSSSKSTLWCMWLIQDCQERDIDRHGKKELIILQVMQFGDMSISKLPVGDFQVSTWSTISSWKAPCPDSNLNSSQGPTPTIGLPRPTHPPHYPPQWFSCGRWILLIIPGPLARSTPPLPPRAKKRDKISHFQIIGMQFLDLMYQWRYSRWSSDNESRVYSLVKIEQSYCPIYFCNVIHIHAFSAYELDFDWNL